MSGKRPFGQWPQAIVEEVGGLLVEHWKTANSLTERAAQQASQWVSSPQRLGRYVNELLAANPLSASKR